LISTPTQQLILLDLSLINWYITPALKKHRGEKSMDFMDRLQRTINQGLDTSKDLFSKARERAVELGDKGVLKFEILQLENQAEKLLSKLGSVTYQTLQESEDQVVSKQSPEVTELITEIDTVRKRIKEKEENLKKYQ
jgi:hypothetical protein